MNAYDSKKQKILMVRMNQEEALNTIISLANQILKRDPNYNRYEKFLEDGRDFSISVDKFIGD